MLNLIPFKYITDIDQFKKEAENEEFYMRKLGVSRTCKDYFSDEVLEKYPQFKSIRRRITAWWATLERDEAGEEKAERANLYSMNEVKHNTGDFIKQYAKNKIEAFDVAVKEFPEIYESLDLCMADFMMEKKYNSFYKGARLICSTEALERQKARINDKKGRSCVYEALAHTCKFLEPKLKEITWFSDEIWDKIKNDLGDICAEKFSETLQAKALLISDTGSNETLNPNMLLLS